jgi:hypothetical protein
LFVPAFRDVLLGADGVDQTKLLVERIDQAIQNFSTIEDPNSPGVDVLYSLSTSFVKIASCCPEIDVDCLGWELKAAFFRMQGRTGWDKVLDVKADKAIRAASATLPDAENNIQRAGEFYKLIGHFL